MRFHPALTNGSMIENDLLVNAISVIFIVIIIFIRVTFHIVLIKCVLYHCVRITWRIVRRFTWMMILMIFSCRRFITIRRRTMNRVTVFRVRMMVMRLVRFFIAKIIAQFRNLKRILK